MTMLFYYEITANDTLDSLQEIALTSKRKHQFSVTKNILMECLESGKPVIFEGIERNPKLAAQLETLVLSNPYLFLQGYKFDLPNADVMFLPATSQQFKGDGSQLFNYLLEKKTQKEKTSHIIYDLLNSLPPCYDKSYPQTPPWNESDFLRLYYKQVAAEQKNDGSLEAKPCHQRQALHTMIAKTYRGNPKVYSFIKAKIEQNFSDTKDTKKRNIDQYALEKWLLAYPDCNLDTIKEHFWELARYCPVDVHRAIESLNEVDDAAAHRLFSYLVAVAPISMKKELVNRYDRDLNIIPPDSFYHGVIRSTLRDGLISEKDQLKLGVEIDQTIHSLEDRILSEGGESDGQLTAMITEELTQLFEKNQLPESLHDLPDALVARRRHTGARQKRRLVQLKNRVEDHPIVFLQGDAGAGKTFMSQAVAKDLNSDKPPILIQIGPNSSEGELFGSQKLIHYSGEDGVDQRTEFCNGPLLEWICSENPPVLILDEANLAPEGLLAPLAGLTRNPPVICYRGKQYPLTDKHRVIMTGNPDGYQGRHLDSALHACVPTLFYHPLTDDELAESIILPGLSESLPEPLKKQACQRLLTLFDQFKTLAGDNFLTPRDITDVLSLMEHIERCQESKVEWTEEKVNALVYRAFMDSLGDSVVDQQREKLVAFESWYRGEFVEDGSILVGIDRNFESFYKQLQQENSDANLSPQPIKKLVYHYWQHLHKKPSGSSGAVSGRCCGMGKRLCS